MKQLKDAYHRKTIEFNDKDNKNQQHQENNNNDNNQENHTIINNY
jgi:hypothetical protein